MIQNRVLSIKEGKLPQYANQWVVNQVIFIMSGVQHTHKFSFQLYKSVIFVQTSFSYLWTVISFVIV
jgi:hypothetical protein